jgi:hypothetical protein
LDRTTEIIEVSSVGEIPTLEAIRTIPRERTLKLVFNKFIQPERQVIGQNLKQALDEFQVGIHTVEPEINIAKLITDNEIEKNQDFFEQCAKDFRRLGEELIFRLADKLGKTINSDHPLLTFNEFKRGKKQTGKLDDWRYYLHGFHCGFKNLKTGQSIEVPLVFGLEFGDLDPYFFSIFIKSTPSYKPLPVAIYEDYADGQRIINKMLSLGKFERINSNVGNHFGIVVVDRQKVKVKTYEELSAQTEKPKNNFWNLTWLKK